MTTPADPSRPAAPSVREIAALTARLREITAQGRVVDPTERARFLADKDALIARITATETDGRRAAAVEATARDAGGAAEPGSPGRDDPAWWALTGPDEVALSRHEVAAELTERGFTPEQARTAISEYLDETSDRIGISVHQWAMDSHDVEAIAHTHSPPVPMPEQRHPSTAEQTTVDQTPARGDSSTDYAGERNDREQARGSAPRSHEQTMGDAAPVLTQHCPGRTTDVEGDRREQLMRWHTDDTAAGPDRGPDGNDIGSNWDDQAMIFEGRPW